MSARKQSGSNNHVAKTTLTSTHIGLIANCLAKIKMLQLVRLPGNVFTCQSLYLPPIDTSTNSTSMKRSSLVLACWVCRKSFNNFPNTPLCYRLPPSPKNRSEVHCVGPRCTAARISSLKSELTVWFLWFGSRGKFYHHQHWSKLAACDGNGLASFTLTHTYTHTDSRQLV